MTATVARTRTGPARIVGIDVTRGLAIFGMVAAHVFPVFTDAGDPSAASIITAGRSATTFAVVAGLSLALLTGGSAPAGGRRRTRAAVGIAVRGVLIGVFGLLLAYLDVALVILSSYGLLFLVAIPLLWLRPTRLAGIAAGLALVSPVVLVWAAAAGLPYVGDQFDPTLETLAQEPGALLALLLVTGYYPVVTYLAYLCAGLAIGRLDLSSRRFAWWLLGGGVTLAGVASASSWVLLHPFGALRRLGETSDLSTADLLWDPVQQDSWWYLALASPHAHTTFDMGRTLGSALALLGASLLLTRYGAFTRLLRPVADAGSMPLTIYSAHLVILKTGLLEDYPTTQFVVLVVMLTVFAVLWRRRYGQGPLERVLAVASRRAAATV